MSAKYGDWTRGEDEALLNILGGVEVDRNILKGTVKVVTEVISNIVNAFTVLVDETLSVEEAIKLGKFGWVNDDITSKTLPKLKDGKKGDKEVAIFHFGKDISSEDAIALMDKAGFKPATIWDLLGLAVKEPNLQRKFQVVALGSVCGRYDWRGAPCLDEDGVRRRLGLRWFDGDWNDSDRFAGVRK